MSFKQLLSVLLFFVTLTAGCSKRSSGTASSSSGAQRRVAEALGNKASAGSDAALNEIYLTTTDKSPAAIRPDPDLYVRRLLRQYRDENAVIAQEIGRVEEYRLLLGGATEDFRTQPQENYDATSLLTVAKVAEDVCLGLVAPTASQHPGWQSILPAAPADVTTNVRFLAQRFIGLPSARISTEVLDALTALIQDAADDAAVQYAHYVPACVALSLDAEALLL